MSTPILFEVTSVKEPHRTTPVVQGAGFKQAFQAAVRTQQQKTEVTPQNVTQNTKIQADEPDVAEQPQLQQTQEDIAQESSEAPVDTSSMPETSHEAKPVSDTPQTEGTDPDSGLSVQAELNTHLLEAETPSELELPVVHSDEKHSEPGLSTSSEITPAPLSQHSPQFWDDFFRLNEMDSPELRHLASGGNQRGEISGLSIEISVAHWGLHQAAFEETWSETPELEAEKTATDSIDLEMPAMNVAAFIQFESQPFSFGTQATHTELQSSALFLWPQMISTFTDADPLQLSHFQTFGQSQEQVLQLKSWSPENWLRLHSKPLQTFVLQEHKEQFGGLTALSLPLKTEISEQIQQMQRLPLNHDARMDLNKQIMRHLDVLRAGRQNQLQVQLEPSLLGKLKLSLQKDGAHYHLQILAENPLTRDLLDSQMLQLRQHLSQQGVLLKDLELGLFQEQAQDHPTHDQQQSHNSSRRLPFALDVFPEIEEPFLEVKPAVDERQVNTLV